VTFTTKTFEGLEGQVIAWSTARGILANSDAKTQFMKAVSEMGELADAINKRDTDGTIDGVGDVLVCLINVCAILGLNLTDCLAAAYDDIKDRKGYLNTEGVFIKEVAA
jgi:hypothetical protein